MKRVFVWLLFGGALAEVSDDAACSFVGVRFAHTVSWCWMRDFCDSISVDAQGRFRPDTKGTRVTCRQARELMTEHLAEMRSGLDHAASEATPVSIHQETLSVLEQVASGLDVDLKYLGDTLAQVSRVMWSRASTDWAAWQASLQVPGPMRNSIEAQHLALTALAWRTQRDAFWSQNRRRLVAACMYYFLDLAVVAGSAAFAVSYENRELVEAAEIWLRDTRPVFRPLLTREHRFVASALDWVRIADALAKGGSFAELVPKEYVFDFVRTWAGPEETLTKTAESGILAEHLCQYPGAFLSAFPGRAFHEDLVHMASNVFLLCTGRAAPAALLALQDLITRKLLKKPHMDMETHYTELTEALNVQSGFREHVSAEAATRKAQALVDRAVRRTGVLTQVGNGETMRFKLPSELDAVSSEFVSNVAFALGVAVRYGADVSFLRLAPQVVRLLHPRIRAHLRMSQVEEICSSLGLEAGSVMAFLKIMSTISANIGEGLGPAGFAMISPDKWMELFAPRHSS